jgi:hypothetical protein
MVGPPFPIEYVDAGMSFLSCPTTFPIFFRALFLSRDVSVVPGTPVPDDFDYFHEMILYDEISRCGNAAGEICSCRTSSRTRVTRASQRGVDQWPRYCDQCPLAIREQAPQGLAQNIVCICMCPTVFTFPCSPGQIPQRCSDGPVLLCSSNI